MWFGHVQRREDLNLVRMVEVMEVEEDPGRLGEIELGMT